MTNFVFLATLIAFFSSLFYWAFRNLPAEEWQIIAAVPFKRREDGTWTGVNLTYYGFFNAFFALRSAVKPRRWLTRLTCLKDL